MNVINKKSFFITLTSGSSLNVYPNNTLSHFTTKLPYTLELNEEWSVGIVKFACTAINYEKFEVEPPKIKFINTAGAFSSDINIFDIVKPHKSFLNTIDQQFFKRYDKNLKLQDHTHTKDIVQVTILNNTYILLMNVLYTSTSLFDEIFSQVPKDKWEKIVEYLEKSRSEKMNIKNFNVIKKRVEYIEPILSSNEIPNYMCFYSDLISPKIFGNVMVRNMFMHPVKFNKQYQNYQNCDVTNIQFSTLEKTKISEISILIADERGEQINFKDDNFNTMIVLEFRNGI